MEELIWITASGIAMSGIALVGAVTLLLKPDTLRAILMPLVALSAGTLLGGALFHLLPAAVGQLGNGPSVYTWLLAGFVAFFALEQFLNWHHCHDVDHAHAPVTYLILVADAVHNFIGGMAVAGAFLADIRLGATAWLAAAAHEIPQELGDFAVLLQGGWSPRRALLFNLVSALTFLGGGLAAYASAAFVDVAVLLPVAAGNFIYIAAADLIPEVKQTKRGRQSFLHFLCFVSGIGLLWTLRILLG